MGLSNSKRNSGGSSSPSSSSASAFARKTRSYRRRVMEYSCLRSHQPSPNARPQVCDNSTQRNAVGTSSAVSDEENHGLFGKVNIQHPDGIDFVTPGMVRDQVGAACVSSEQPRPYTNFYSRLNRFPGTVSHMLRRVNNICSARPHTSPAARFEMSNNYCEPGSFGIASQGDIFSTCFASQSARSVDEELASYNARKRSSNKCCRKDSAGVVSSRDLGSASHAYAEGFEERLADRRFAPGEIVESNARFSRTLSVGRLRDRGLRRTPFPDIDSTSLQLDRDANRVSERESSDSRMEIMTSEGNIVNANDSSHEAGIISSLYGTQNDRVDISRPREPRYHDLLEYRSNFLERRRRIRSQVRALQRIGSRFEHTSGHERTCILFGQPHERGHCTCRVDQQAHQIDESRARANISRIVMLAESLFEVLDEIHQQSVALSSRTSLSSIGSVPAPVDVVELLPVKSLSEMQEHVKDEAAQCYICLIEYGEGDLLRILPCRHNFHKACIDKWLKEIHRVCPLCRADVCKPNKLLAAS